MTENKVAVEQIDRDAAADSTVEGSNVQELMRSGKYDHHALVQSFARHRTRALEASQAAEIARLKLDVAAQEMLQCSVYRAGLKAGWNFATCEDDIGYQRAMSGTDHIAELKRIRAARAALKEPT